MSLGSLFEECARGVQLRFEDVSKRVAGRGFEQIVDGLVRDALEVESASLSVDPVIEGGLEEFADKLRVVPPP